MFRNLRPNHFKLASLLGSINFLKEIYLYIPLIFTFGPRSFVAQDEGYYALQSKWILDTGNWLAPMWWSVPTYDRTIGVQWLIAGFQKIFGQSIFVAHLPSIISGIISLFLTYKISCFLIGKSFSWLSPLVLSLSYLWIDNLHLATQDMPLLAVELFGIYSILKASKSYKSKWFFFSGISIGIAFMLKSFMIFLPIIAIIPFLFSNSKDIFLSKYFYIGLIIGFLPFCIWIALSLKVYGTENVSLLYTKLLDLSTTSSYSRSPIYYFWNLPINTFPWCILALLGIIRSFQSFSINKKLLIIGYPFMLFVLLSLFNTKTPYYGLQLTPFIAINATIAIKDILHNDTQLSRSCLFIISLIGSLILLIGFINLTFKFTDISSNFPQELLVTILLLTGFSLTSVYFARSKSTLLLALFAGPYLSFILATQNGLFTDRNPNFRKAYFTNDISHKLENNYVNFIFPDYQLSSQSFSQVVRLGLYSKNSGNIKLNPLSLREGEYAWIEDSKIKQLPINSYDVIKDDPIFDPWTLIFYSKK
ncbi:MULTISPECIES: ArnT family glycosyltransferase [Prochlorococcus]|uniref:Glycosyltransferase of PMT family n=1 Tax=Prochlorococcus marinus (strain SARG / CCMP1375 / SS120) TaxID=167539 RepID=Q7VEF4_PROMA|nr:MULTISPECIES: glycosyltransferase family 39 protein [Prochlorococcus]AAP99105.1 Glycosyltransferase of PMT family [Prochlorococcus marinus subsp. marinus str. CCMP1375]KGG11635.1 Dolichyl-phosphate-mannose-protein mannosyltransferase [Prochlorococcus marinus str. LG]KGG22357.1 Dolichyl-phosphate-mannose-protein mannosyltransferase [Prochlorococcus marinus str. SS2]KGG22693.1 Dolichyl-phosphate-mannose-protein mannosyltransferase [Prochlorococcus marinus str. SS35]KGG32886.1 Dolichyl-phospha